MRPWSRTCSAAGRPVASPGRSCSRRRSRRCGPSSDRSAPARRIRGGFMATVAPPAGPKAHWLTGHLADFRAGALEFLARCAREYGDFVPLRLGFKKILLVSDPKAIEEVLLTRSRDFIKHFGLQQTRM